MLANVQQATIKPVITAAVTPGTLIHTDEYGIYARLPSWDVSGVPSGQHALWL